MAEQDGKEKAVNSECVVAQEVASSCPPVLLECHPAVELWETG